MAKRTIFNAFPALAAIVAITALLASCGEGEPEDININDPLNYLTQAIEACKGDNGAAKGCPKYGDSSPSEGSSPSGGPSPSDGSSSSGGTSSGIYNPDPDPVSSSSARPSSSSVALAADAYPKPRFSCYWEPDSAVSGDETTLKYSAIDGVVGSQSDCKIEKARKTYCNPLTGNCDTKAYIYFTDGQKIKTSGTHLDMEGPANYITEKTWPTDGNFVVSGAVFCEDKSLGIYKPQLHEEPCTPLKILKAPPPDSSKINLVCNWTTYPTDSKNLALNYTPPACTVTGTIDNAALAGCDTPVFEELPAGSTSVANRAVYAKAVTTCRGTKYTLKTLTYTVIPDPSLGGTCSWSSFPTTISKGSAPKGGELNNSYGRCKSGNGAAIANTTTAYTLTASDYFYGGTAWPTVNSALQVQTYKDVATNISCSPAPIPPGSSITQIKCSDLDVTLKSPCEGEDKLATLCPGVLWEDIDWTGTKPPNRSKATCHFVTGVTGNIRVNGSGLMMNGGASNGGITGNIEGNNMSGKAKIDGGYYVSISQSSDSWMNWDGVTSAKPFCAGGSAPTLTCGNLTDINAWAGYPITLPLTCSDGYTPDIQTLTGGIQPNLTNPAAGNYSGFTVTATCGNASVTSGTCTGTLSVSGSPPATYDWISYKTGVSGTYILGNVCSSAPFYAYCGNKTCSFTVNDVTYPIPVNGSLKFPVGTFKTGDLVTFTGPVDQLDCRN